MVIYTPRYIAVVIYSALLHYYSSVLQYPQIASIVKSTIDQGLACRLSQCMTEVPKPSRHIVNCAVKMVLQQHRRIFIGDHSAVVPSPSLSLLIIHTQK